MKSKIVCVLLSITLGMFAASCGKTQDSEIETSVDMNQMLENSVEESQIAINSSETESIVESAEVESETETNTEIESESQTVDIIDTDLYTDFLMSDEKLYFNNYMQEDYNGPLFETGKGYSLSDLMEKFKEIYYIDKEPQINYSYIDCGNDGVSEFAIQFYGMNIYGPEDDSTLVYVVKDIDGQLELCYTYETWARSESTLNSCGYYTSGGSNGASNHGFKSGYIDANGKWNFINYTEEEWDVSQLVMRNDQLSKVAEVAQTKTYDQDICVISTRFEENYDTSNYYYTYTVENEDDNLYTDSVYKDIFDEAGVTYYTWEEMENMISEKEKSVGVTEEIKAAAEVEWLSIEQLK